MRQQTERSPQSITSMVEGTVVAGPSPQEQKRVEPWKSPLFRWLSFGLLLILFVCTYYTIGKELLRQTNQTRELRAGSDQLHNMRLATQTRPDLNPNFNHSFLEPLKNWFPHRTDGVINPLWPWMTAWMVEPGHKISEEEVRDKIFTEETEKLYERGRNAQLYMTLGFLLMLGIGAARLFSLAAACNLLLLGAFGVFLPRAAFFQPEPVYYMFFFLTWVACVSALNHNSLWIYAFIGILGGIAFLAKGSVQPLLVVFVGVSSLRCVWEFFSAQRRGLALGGTHLWHWRNHLVGLVFLGAAFMMTAGPRLRDSYDKFGSMFHSYPGYWMWMDNFKEGYQWMADHNSKESLQTIDPQEKPTAWKYFHTHTGQEALDRLWNGVHSRVGEFFWPKQTIREKSYAKMLEKHRAWHGLFEWRGIYLGWLALILTGLLTVLATVAPKAEHAGHLVFRHGTVTIILFVVGSFAAYSLSYGWYAAIAPGSGDRFMLSLYLPLVFSFIWGGETIVRRLRRRKSSPWVQWGYLTAQWLLFAALCWRLVEIVRYPHFFDKV